MHKRDSSVEFSVICKQDILARILMIREVSSFFKACIQKNSQTLTTVGGCNDMPVNTLFGTICNES